MKTIGNKPRGRRCLPSIIVTVLGHATCQILPCSATLLLARLLLAPWRSPRDICLPSLLYIPLLLLLSLVSSLDSNPQASLQRHLCEPSQRAHSQPVKTKEKPKIII